MQHPKLRDSKKLHMNELYPINEFPLEVIRKIGKRFIYYKFVGRSDISGNDWADVFAEAIGGNHKNSSLGLTDVSYGKMAWSMKTIKVKKLEIMTYLLSLSLRKTPLVLRQVLINGL